MIKVLNIQVTMEVEEEVVRGMTYTYHTIQGVTVDQGSVVQVDDGLYSVYSESGGALLPDFEILLDTRQP